MGGLGWDVEGLSFQSRLGQRKERWREKGRRSSCVEWRCLNCSPTPWAETLENRTGWVGGESHQSPAAGQQVEPLAGEDICWGRTVDGDCLGGRWASDRQREAAEPQLRQPERTRSEDPTGAHPHARPLSLPPSENHFPSTNTPSSSQRRHPRHLEQTVLLPFAPAIYTSKAQGENSNNLHTVSESNKQTHCPGGLPKPFWPAGSGASLIASCLVKPLQH